MLIDIFHDPVCPWCRIGKKHLFDALAQWTEKTIEICWHPFLLDNSIPCVGYDFRSFMQSRKGISAEGLQHLFDYTRRKGEEAGVVLDFDKIRLAVNTQLAHLLIELAPAIVKNDVVEAIYQAYFEQGLNLGDIDVLVNIGTVHQMNKNELRSQLQDETGLKAIVAQSKSARASGITSVPIFIFNNKVTVDGSQSVDVFLQALNRAAFMEISKKIW